MIVELEFGCMFVFFFRNKELIIKRIYLIEGYYDIFDI